MGDPEKLPILCRLQRRYNRAAHAALVATCLIHQCISPFWNDIMLIFLTFMTLLIHVFMPDEMCSHHKGVSSP